MVVLNGRNFPSFQAGDQGRVIRVDKEALNCEVPGKVGRWNHGWWKKPWEFTKPP